MQNDADAGEGSRGDKNSMESLLSLSVLCSLVTALSGQQNFGYESLDPRLYKPNYISLIFIA